MLTPTNTVNYSDPNSFNCGTEQQQLAFIANHEITKAQFDVIVAWFNGPNSVPAPYVVSGLDMTNLIGTANCQTEAVVLLGDITTLGHTDMNIDLMTYQDISNNPPANFLGAYGIDLFAGLMKLKGADAFNFYKGTYTYTTNPNQKLESAMFVAYANEEPVYYAEYITK
jgi:hypothetical protein